MQLPSPPLLVITDRSRAKRPLDDVVDAAFAAGCRWLLVREKDLPSDELLGLAGRMVRLAEPYGATISVSGDPATARECGAQGVHLSADRDVGAARALLGRDFLIGKSTHYPDEAESAERGGADYITLSPVFPTESKPGYGPALGPEGISPVAAARSIPILALGGITAGNAAACLAAGAAGIAVMGGVMAADDPSGAVTALLAALG